MAFHRAASAAEPITNPGDALDLAAEVVRKIVAVASKTATAPRTSVMT
jgi:hypothetical protein